MVAVSPARTLALALLGIAIVTSACSRQTPTEVTLAYFDFLDGDPSRTLGLLSDRFQRDHGLRYETFARLGDDRGSGDGDSPSARRPALVSQAAEQADPAFALYRARFGWITALSLWLFYDRMPGIRFVPIDERISDGVRADVELVAQEWSGLSLPTRVRLSRATPASRWRIDAIQVSPGTSPEESALAFLVSPSLESQQRLKTAQREARRKQRRRRGKAR
jgi:hypothetical protein